MDIDFADHQLSLIETDQAAETGLPVAVIVAARQCLTLLRALPDLRSAKNWRSLGLREEVEDRGKYLVALPAPWAMILTIEETNDAMTLIVKAIQSQSRVAA